MLPKKELNIYPKTDENIKALISYYFDDYEVDFSESVSFLNQKTAVTLNQMEFVVQKLSEAYLKVFREELNGTIRLTTLLSYGFEALTINEADWQGSKPRIQITKKFRDFVINTSIDFI